MPVRSDERAAENARDRTIFADLALHAVGCVRNVAVEQTPRERLGERALMSRQRVSLKYTSCYGRPITAHLGLLPATMTNSPGIR